MDFLPLKSGQQLARVPTQLGQGLTKTEQIQAHVTGP